MNLRELVESRIVKDQEICNGKARIKGTRVPVTDILLAFSEGMEFPDVLRNFRSLTNQDIQAALAYSYCVIDGIQVNIRTSFGEIGRIDKASSTEIRAIELEDKDNIDFTKALEEQAAIQEEITREKVKEIKAKKKVKSKAPDKGKISAPQRRPYDLLIDISEENSNKVFNDSDNIEQGLDMQLDNYIFELRADAQPWLCYSTKQGIEIDPAMKRNLLVTYINKNGQRSEAIFEGYLTTDRQHKIFLQKNDDGSTCGRAL